MGRPIAALLGAMAVVLTTLSPVTEAAAQGACEPGPVPVGLAGASLEPTVETSKDDPPVRYVIWRGTVPSFDGMPLSVDVTVPCAGADGDDEGKRPLVVMPHGFTDDKTVWEETGKSDKVTSEDRPGPNSRWNNIWFASRGYTTLTYTARGWHDSCGPDTPRPPTDSGAVDPCEGYEYWIHLDDQRWEVRDAQWLTAALVQGDTVDPERLAITGGSYGGGPTSMAALLGDRVVCGGDPVPAALGPDPCAGASDGARRPWTTPDGKERLSWAAALPLYTFADLLQVLAPNGRWSDGWRRAPDPGSPVEPFGVPIESTLNGLLLAATAFGSLAPPGTDPTSDIQASAQRLLDGNPFPPDDPQIEEGVEQYRRFKSPILIEPTEKVPIFWVQGSTDALFPGSEALTMVDHLRSEDPDYPIKVFLGDIGHDYAAERTDEWDLVKGQMNAFIDHFLRPDRTPDAPDYDAGATVTRCLDHDAPLRYVHARTWDALHPSEQVFRSTAHGRTSTTEQGPHGRATDPISTATLPGPDSYKGCRIVKSLAADDTVATYEFTVRDTFTMVGAPVVDLTLDSTGTEAPVAVRLWDVDPEGGRMGLVTRGVYRMDEPAGRGHEVRLQLAPQGYRFPVGHRIRVEVTGNDSPYYQASSIRSDLLVRKLTLHVPRHVRDDPTSRDTKEATASESGDDDGPGPLRILVVLGLIGAGLFVAAKTALDRYKR